MKVFKIRASQIGKIMTGTIGLTEKQEEKLNQLILKAKRTENQERELKELTYKKNNPELPKTLTTYCKSWLKEQLFNRGKYFSNRYTDKGNIMENDSIDFIAKMLDYGMLLKNMTEFENEYIVGTPDIITKDCVIDAKNSWDYETFPFFEDVPTTTDYEWQLQGYMDLLKKEDSKLCYILSNTPDQLIEKESRYFCSLNGFEELDADIYKNIYDRMNYDDIEDKYRIKTYEYKRDEIKINAIYERVVICRNYIDLLIKSNNIS